MLIGIVADEGFAARIAASLTTAVEEAARAALGADSRISVEQVVESLPLNQEGKIPLVEAGSALRRRHGWDAVVYLTDLPRLSDTGPGLVGEFDHDSRIMLVSVPALGFIGVRRRARRVVREGIRVVLAAEVDELDPVVINNPLEARLAPVQRTSEVGADSSVFELRGVRGYLELLAGMVRSNRPWRLLPSLSGALAAAAAVGAFGIFYTSVWAMSDALSVGRLALITLFSLAIIVFWLVIHNGLWECGSGRTPRARAMLYNTFTGVTIFIGALTMYVMLYLVLLLGALTVIEVGFLSGQLGHPAGWLDYLDIAWLSSSLGTVAGALGSSFDDEEAIRRATYSRRENERHRLMQELDRDEGRSSDGVGPE
ncbi:hypothetical protein BKD30_13420 [Tersicoccus phoenicis]|uniref:5,10-methylene-tetrahydrofolate dehydrogenase n=1 Tax=Tersicoccus phoenicis TaxID=554083 RepID=A0A1R1L753_9MICC|nr:hypothetical protein BKD30_13420 [Tersicoccus phoenicis]